MPIKGNQTRKVSIEFAPFDPGAYPEFDRYAFSFLLSGEGFGECPLAKSGTQIFPPLSLFFYLFRFFCYSSSFLLRFLLYRKISARCVDGFIYAPLLSFPITLTFFSDLLSFSPPIPPYLYTPYLLGQENSMPRQKRIVEIIPLFPPLFSLILSFFFSPYLSLFSSILLYHTLYLTLSSSILLT